MNETDIKLTASVDIVGVTGLERVRAEIRKSAAESFTNPLGGKIENKAAVKRLAAFDQAVELLRDVNKGTTEERLTSIRGARRLLNIASRQDFSTEAHKAIALLEERVNATSSVLRTQAKREGALPSNIPSTRTLRSRVTRALNKMDAGEGVWADGTAEDKRIEAEYIQANLDRWKQVTASKNPTGILSPKEWDYYKKTQNKITGQLESIKGNTNPLKGLVGSTAGVVGGLSAAVGAASALANIESDYYKSNQKFRYERQWLNTALKWGGGIAGALGGAATGAAAGSFLPGVGNIAGAIVGFLGGAFGGAFAGAQHKVRMEAADKSKEEALNTWRYRGLYGGTAGAGGWQLAKAAAATGLATTSDIETLASNAQEFQAAMAFGGISDQQMLGLSMLPNYYAALAGGASPDEAFAAYMSDIQGMSPGLAQYASRMAGVPDNLRALANNPSLANRFLTEGYGQAVGLEAAMGDYSGGFVHGYYSEQLENLRLEQDAWRKGAASASKYDYDKSYSGTAYHYDEASGEYIRYDASKAPPNTTPTGLGPADVKGKDLVKRELNIYVNDGRKTTIGSVYTDEEIGDQISYAIGEF